MAEQPTGPGSRRRKAEDATMICPVSDEDSEMDPCNYCPHDNTRHRGDGCLHCGCVVPQ